MHLLQHCLQVAAAETLSAEQAQTRKDTFKKTLNSIASDRNRVIAAKKAAAEAAREASREDALREQAENAAYRESERLAAETRRSASVALMHAHMAAMAAKADALRANVALQHSHAVRARELRQGGGSAEPLLAADAL